jgi:hypothetical protein
MDFESVVTTVTFKRVSKEEIFSKVIFLKKKFSEIKKSNSSDKELEIRRIGILTFYMLKSMAKKDSNKS